MSPTNSLPAVRPPRTEREYLQQQAAYARDALKRVGKETAQTASQPTSLVGYVDRHPILTLGIATLGGALLGGWLAGPRTSAAPEPRRPRQRLSSHFSSIYHSVVAPPLQAAIHQAIAQISHGFASQQHGEDQAASEPQATGTTSSPVP
jgi:hypothetical protein